MNNDTKTDDQNVLKKIIWIITFLTNECPNIKTNKIFIWIYLTSTLFSSDGTPFSCSLLNSKLAFSASKFSNHLSTVLNEFLYMSHNFNLSHRSSCFLFRASIAWSWILWRFARVKESSEWEIWQASCTPSRALSWRTTWGWSCKRAFWRVSRISWSWKTKLVGKIQ